MKSHHVGKNLGIHNNHKFVIFLQQHTTVTSLCAESLLFFFSQLPQQQTSQSDTDIQASWTISCELL